VSTPIGDGETAGELHTRLVSLGTDLLVRTVPEVATIEPAPQSGEATYAEKLTVEEFHLDPAAAADELVRRVRAGNPRPGAWLEVDGKRLKVWRAHADDGRFVPDEVQPEGKRPMPYAAWRAGHRGDPFA
jgi:methionyl-tRNA formyltransferase